MEAECNCDEIRPVVIFPPRMRINRRNDVPGVKPTRSYAEVPRRTNKERSRSDVVDFIYTRIERDFSFPEPREIYLTLTRIDEGERKDRKIYSNVELA